MRNAHVDHFCRTDLFETGEVVAATYLANLAESALTNAPESRQLFKSNMYLI